MRTAKTCGPDAPMAGVKLARSSRFLGATVTSKLWSNRGEHGISCKTIAQGRPDASAEPVCSCAFFYLPLHARPRVQRAPGLPCALVSLKSVRMCERAVGSEPPVAGTEPVAPKGARACKRARDSSGVFLNPNSCRGFEPVPGKEGSG